jgi:hypothetical protein
LDEPYPLISLLYRVQPCKVRSDVYALALSEVVGNYAGVTIVGLAVMEIVYIIYFEAWNSEIFSAITGLVDLVVGTLIGANIEGGG